MEDEHPKQQEPVATKTTRNTRSIVLWSLALAFISFLDLFLLGWLGSDQDLLSVCGLLIFTGLSGLGMALLTPVYARSKKKVAAVVLTLLYVCMAAVVGLFMLAIIGWTLYSNSIS